MKFTIEPDVIKSDSHDTLYRLWYSLEALHDYKLNSFEQVDAWETSSWLCNVPKEIKDIIEHSITIWTQNNEKCTECKIVSLTPSDNVYSIDEIINFSNQTFLIIVEDYNSDRKFFNCLLRLFKDESKKISLYRGKMKLEFFNGGGSTITRIIEGKVQELLERQLNPNKNNRLFILLDSDKFHPKASLKKEDSDLTEFCDSYNIAYHIFEKREIENYMPDFLIQRLKHGNNDSFIDSFLELNDRQRDYFDLEKGFNGKNVRNLEDEIQTFFPDQKLNNSLRVHNWDRKVAGNSFKNYVAELWSDSELTKEMLLERCEHHSDDPDIHPHNKRELPDLLKKISDLL